MKTPSTDNINTDVYSPDRTLPESGLFSARSGDIWAKYANISSGPDADVIGWLVFDGYGIDHPFPNPFTQHYVEYLSYPYGYSVAFDLSVSIQSDDKANRVFVMKPPTYSMAAFGHSGYLNIEGPVVFYTTTEELGANTSVDITLNNIKVTGPSGSNQKFPYHIVTVDGETTNINEGWGAVTNGGNWELLGILPPSSPPTGRLIYRGLGTKSYWATGSSTGPMPALVIASSCPTSVKLHLTSYEGKQGAAIGIMIDLPNPYKKSDANPFPMDLKTFCW